MKKLSAYLLLSCLLVASISACGSKDDEVTPATADKHITMQVRADAGNGQVIVDWQMMSIAQYYNIYYFADTAGAYNSENRPSTATMKAGTKIGNVLSATRTITGLTNGTKYWIALSGYNPVDGEGYITNPISVTPQATARLTAPENVRANAGNAQVTVTWTPVAGADHYILCCYYLDISSSTGLIAGYGETAISGGSTSSAVVGTMTWLAGEDEGTTTTSLLNGRTYYFYVIASDAGESSDVISGASFFTSATPNTSHPPTAPVVTNVTAGDQQITITWNPVTASPDVTYYYIYISTAKGVLASSGTSTEIPADASNPYVASTTATLTNGITYYIVITAFNANGESAESTEWWAIPASGGGTAGPVE